MGSGLSFDDAFTQATGESTSAAEAAYWGRRTFWDRWVPVLSSSTILWIGVTLLGVAAMRRRRARDAEIHRQWGQWEAERDEPAGDDHEDDHEVVN